MNTYARVTNSTELSHFWKGDSHSANQEIPASYETRSAYFRTLFSATWIQSISSHSISFLSAHLPRSLPKYHAFEVLTITQRVHKSLLLATVDAPAHGMTFGRYTVMFSLLAIKCDPASDSMYCYINVRGDRCHKIKTWYQCTKIYPWQHINNGTDCIQLVHAQRLGFSAAVGLQNTSPAYQIF